MTTMLPSWPTLSAFLLASVVLAVTPGPGVVYIVTRSLAQGRRSGLASVFGVAAGNLCNAVAAAIGLGALLAVSAAAFAVVKVAGAAYLVFLGVQSLRKRPAASAEPQQLATTGSILRDGFFVALLNPKTAIFFGAFLPQFMARGMQHPALGSVLLGAMFVAIATVTDSAYALLAGSVAGRFSTSGRVRFVGRYATSLVYFGLGALALASPGQKAR